jgi:hypothetical protein
MGLEGQAAQLMDGVTAGNPNADAGIRAAETNIERVMFAPRLDVSRFPFAVGRSMLEVRSWKFDVRRSSQLSTLNSQLPPLPNRKSKIKNPLPEVNCWARETDYE